MTALEKEISNLPKLQKLCIMEQIWSDLTVDEDNMDIPEWHFKELAEIEESIAAGNERFLDWESAKKAIRDA